MPLRNARRLLAGFAAVLLAGCAHEMTQHVTGEFTIDGQPVRDAGVRLVSGKDATSCLNSRLEASVKEGSFSLQRQVETGHLSTEVQRDGLCIKDQGAWVLVWNSAYSPAPETLAFTCNKGNEHWSCKATGLTAPR